MVRAGASHAAALARPALEAPGAAAAFQRDYFKSSDVTCAKASTIAVTVIAGSLNYLGVNPKVKCPNVKTPQPSK